MARTVQQEAERYQLNRRDRADIVLELKIRAGACAERGPRCLSRRLSVAEYPELFQYDHVRGRKRFEIGAWIAMRGGLGRGNRSLEALLDELDKCELICVICHYGRTRDRHHRG